VDVFFVISGFLITRILQTDFAKSQFSLTDFYARRIRRIFPTLILVLLACLFVGWRVLLANEYAQLGWHVAAGAGFISNLALWTESGYFDTASELKPLLHLWSLGIEEQFYIVWPCLVWLAYRFRASLIQVIAGLFLASFAWGVFTIGSDAVSAFYLPYCRAWELLVGASLAWASRQAHLWQSRIRTQHREGLGALGLTLVTLPMVLLDKAALFPGGWALLPTVGAALLIAAEDSWVNTRLLSRPVWVGIGLISYPLYLWHWPLLSFGRILENAEPPVLWRVGLVVAAIALSTLTYLGVEKWLRHRGRIVTAMLALTMLIIGLLGWNVYSREGLEFRYRKIIELPAQMKRDFTKWEDKGMYPEGECSPDFVYPNARICLQSTEGATPTSIVFGDSHAFHAYWGIARSWASEQQVVKLVGRGGCNFGLYRGDADCIRTFESQVEWMVENESVRNVLIVHRLVISKDSSPSDQADFEQRLGTALERLIRRGKQVVYVLPVPELRFNPRLCTNALPFGRKADVSSCDFPLSRELELQQIQRMLVDRWRAKFPGLVVFDPSSTLCPQGRCQAVRESRVLWMDDNHVSETGSYQLGEALSQTVRLH
jgi:peptidoglycan/LPS O-acetylase OafA/YrhL